jgi:hypothetical protein
VVSSTVRVKPGVNKSWALVTFENQCDTTAAPSLAPPQPPAALATVFLTLWFALHPQVKRRRRGLAGH